MKNKSLFKLIMGTALIATVSCTKLTETDLLYDKVNGDEFGKTALEVQSLVGAAYSNLSGIGGNNHYIPLNEVTTDEMIVPTRGADWGDGGHWVRLKKHTYNSNDPLPSNGWSFCYTGVSTCNRLLAMPQINSDEGKAYIPELKVLRALYYYWLLDWYGNVPLSIDYADTKPPANATRQQVYDFIEKELLENGPQLPKAGPNEVATYGRVTYYTAYAILAKLYLNAKVYTGTAQWDKAIAMCDTIINSSKYSLAPNYVDNFVPNNSTSKEFIFAVPFDHVHLTGFNLGMMTLSYLNQGTYNINAQPWNGFATVSEFYNSYIDTIQNPGPHGTVIGLDPRGTPTTGTVDKRMQANFIVGPQYDSKGVRLTDAGADPTDPDSAKLTFTPYINELEPQAWRQSGARIGKWQFYYGMTADLDNDFAIFRYADILLTKAEAVAWKTGNWSNGTTLDIVNTIRVQHGGVDPLPALTAKTFLAERSREMFAEAWKRQDMIRFGTYNSAYSFHPADPDDHVNIFPIPATQLNANPNLKQNPGYN